jgi:hypothetical protein
LGNTGRRQIGRGKRKGGRECNRKRIKKQDMGKAESTRVKYIHSSKNKRKICGKGRNYHERKINLFAYCGGVFFRLQ